MQTTEEAQLVLSIIEHAQNKQYTKFHLITSWEELKFYKQTLKATKIVIKILQRSAKNLFKTYCRSIYKEGQKFVDLLAYSELQDIIQFYKLELIVIDYMIREYYKELLHESLPD